MRSNPLILALFLLVFCFTSTARATIWTVDNTGNPAADFTTVQDAHDSGDMADGDTVYVQSSTVAYGDLTATRPLVWIGTGYFLEENPETQAHYPSSTIGRATLNEGSSGTVLMGLSITGQVKLNDSNMIIQRNNITAYESILIGPVSTVLISQNVITPSGWAAAISHKSYDSISNITIENNIIIAGHAFSFNDKATNVIVRNNVFKGTTAFNGATLENNIFIEGTADLTACTLRSNLANGTQFGSDNGNQANVDMTKVFYGGDSPDGQYQLADSSPAIGAGVQGFDCGAFGGPNPYVLSGLPPIPTITEFTAPATASYESGLQIQVRVISRN